MKALLNQTKTALAAFAIAVGLGGAAAAQDNVAGNNVDTTTVSLEQTEIASLNAEQAAELSRGQIVLQFGEGFPEIVRNGIISNLTRNNFEFTAVQGGSDGHLDLFIDGQKGKKPFNPEEAVAYLLSVLEKNASQFRLANVESNDPILDAG